MSALFILGDLSFDQWDTYVNELKGIGSDEYVRLVQESYDKMVGK
jgi:putative aldouronate transport system substrate-binding protein